MSSNNEFSYVPATMSFAEGATLHLGVTQGNNSITLGDWLTILVWDPLLELSKAF